MKRIKRNIVNINIKGILIVISWQICWTSFKEIDIHYWYHKKLFLNMYGCYLQYCGVCFTNKKYYLGQLGLAPSYHRGWRITISVLNDQNVQSDNTVFKQTYSRLEYCQRCIVVPVRFMGLHQQMTCQSQFHLPRDRRNFVTYKFRQKQYNTVTKSRYTIITCNG